MKDTTKYISFHPPLSFPPLFYPVFSLFPSATPCHEPILRQRTGERPSVGFPSLTRDPDILSPTGDWQQESKWIPLYGYSVIEQAGWRGVNPGVSGSSPVRMYIRQIKGK